MEEIRAELGLQPSDKVIFGCGTMDWRKGPDLFAEIAHKVLADAPEARFIWIGADTGDESGIRAKSLATDPRIRFIGERENPRDYLALGSAFLLSSREDPFPLVTLEAADAGLPAVCFADAGGMPDFVGNSCGRTVPYKDIDSAARALTEILSNDSLREELGRTAQSRVRSKHDAAGGGKAVLLVLASLASGNTPERPVAKNIGPLVSVIVPNYNHARFLIERLQSIARQTLRDLEIILLDDCSTDESLSILTEFAAREPRAHLVPNAKNSGSTFKQWRKGLAMARGKYIWIAESDDSAHPELLATLVARLEANPNAVLAACCPRMTDVEGNDLGIPKDWFSDIGGARWEEDFSSAGRREIADVLAQKNAILNASGAVFRNKSDLRELVDESMRLCADWLFWVRLMARGDFEYVARPLNYWRLASSNARTKPPGETEWNEGSRVLRETRNSSGKSARHGGKRHERQNPNPRHPPAPVPSHPGERRMVGARLHRVDECGQGKAAVSRARPAAHPCGPRFLRFEAPRGQGGAGEPGPRIRDRWLLLLPLLVQRPQAPRPPGARHPRQPAPRFPLLPLLGQRNLVAPLARRGA